MLIIIVLTLLPPPLVRISETMTALIKIAPLSTLATVHILSAVIAF
jgi:hypothetical protein